MQNCTVTSTLNTWTRYLKSKHSSHFKLLICIKIAHSIQEYNQTYGIKWPLSTKIFLFLYINATVSTVMLSIKLTCFWCDLTYKSMKLDLIWTFSPDQFICKYDWLNGYFFLVSWNVMYNNSLSTCLADLSWCYSWNRSKKVLNSFKYVRIPKLWDSLSHLHQLFQKLNIYTVNRI